MGSKRGKKNRRDKTALITAELLLISELIQLIRVLIEILERMRKG